MKFAGSQFEERYNQYWNKNIVSLDNAIRRCILGFKLFDDGASVGTLIAKYLNHVRNILSNLDRQAPQFEDNDYIQQYRQNTVDQVLEDFNFYANVFPEFKNAPAELKKVAGLSDSESSAPGVPSML